jgi:hypothetical protein
LMTILSFAFAIGGLIKKKRPVWITSLVLFVTFVMLAVFSVVIYAKKSIDYIGSEEFQEETRKKAENMGKTWGNTVSGTAQGLEASLNDTAISKLANKGSKIIGSGIKSIASGMDITVNKTVIYSDESLKEAEIVVGRAETFKNSDSLALFIEFRKAYNGALVLTSYDKEDLQVDNSTIQVNAIAGDANVYIFKFKHFQPGLSNYCILKTK